ncbi:PREDICTED: C-X-C motif chemokine 16 [Chinchilla lanigera]|uniref:C-X-C motif chemokine 16 n=1 Tax=Chinchilla lanigera TaxID=34839 RepID=A0A8C2VB73_CHILA|nr:PREDICTED: C-X-C motif chemokine 16 [Chinchilla lanigera]
MGTLVRTLLLLLALVIRSGDGNEGSIAGSCHCDRIIPSNVPAHVQFMEHFRKYGKSYHRCPSYVRFELRSQSVCGGSRDQWVLEVMSCFDRRECGHAYRENQVHQKHSSSHGTLIPRPPEGTPPDRSTPAQKYPPSASQPTPKPTLLPGTFFLDKHLTHLNETTTPIVGYSQEAGCRIKGNQKEPKEKAGAPGGSSAVVPVLSLLVIVFLFTGIFFYMKCRRREVQSQQYSPVGMASV